MGERVKKINMSLSAVIVLYLWLVCLWSALLALQYEMYTTVQFCVYQGYFHKDELILCEAANFLKALYYAWKPLIRFITIYL